MKIKVLSDTHHEFYKDLDKNWIRSIDIKDVDVLVLAGDICSSRRLSETLCLYADLGLPIVYVAGNHEYWGSSREKVMATIDDISRKYNYGNFHWLNDSTVTIKGQRFVGAPLWYTWSHQTQLKYKYWPDFCNVSGMPNKWIFESGLFSKKFFDKTVNEDDIVVSHMLPSYQSVAPRFKYSDYNGFFVNDCEKIILKNQPKVWIHGHSHDPVDYNIDKTRVVSNPRGYPRTEYGHGMEGGDREHENAVFNEHLTVEV